MFTVKNLITAAKQRAKQFGVPFDLVFEDLGAPDICPVLQVPLDYSRKGKGGHRWNSPSIDRMVPERGYVKGNVAIISFRANTIKSNATPDELYRVYKYAGSRT